MDKSFRSPGTDRSTETESLFERLGKGLIDNIEEDSPAGTPTAGSMPVLKRPKQVPTPQTKSFLVVKRQGKPRSRAPSEVKPSLYVKSVAFNEGHYKLNKVESSGEARVDSRGVPIEHCNRLSNSSLHVRDHHIAFRSTLEVIHEVESWKRFNVVEDEKKKDKYITCMDFCMGRFEA